MERRSGLSPTTPEYVAVPAMGSMTAIVLGDTAAVEGIAR